MLCYRCGSFTPDDSRKCTVCGQPIAKKRRQAQEAASRGSTLLGVPPYLPGSMIVGRYRVVESISQGSAGWVLRARDEEVDIDVALKVISSNLTQSEDDKRRFLKSLQQATKIRHPNLVRIYEDGRDGDYLFYTMPFLQGLNLRKIVDLRLEKGGIFTMAETLPLVGQLALAIDSIGKFGYHGAIRPASVVVLPDMVKLTGLAHLQGLPRKPFIALCDKYRDLHYISQEARREASDLGIRTDIYSMAAIFGEMLTGELYGKNLEAWEDALKVLPGQVAAVLNRALNADPMTRYESGTAFFEALAVAANMSPSLDSATTPLPYQNEKTPLAGLLGGDATTVDLKAEDATNIPAPPASEKEQSFADIKPEEKDLDLESSDFNFEAPEPTLLETPTRDFPEEPSPEPGPRSASEPRPGGGIPESLPTERIIRREKESNIGFTFMMLALVVLLSGAAIAGALWWNDHQETSGSSSAIQTSDNVHDTGDSSDLTDVVKPSGSLEAADKKKSSKDKARDKKKSKAASKTEDRKKALAKKHGKKAHKEVSPHKTPVKPEPVPEVKPEPVERKPIERKPIEKVVKAPPPPPPPPPAPPPPPVDKKVEKKVEKKVVVAPEPKEEPKPVAVKKEGCPGGMVLIAAGSFTFGSAMNDPMRGFGEINAQRRNVKAYCIDLYEYPNTKGRTPTAKVSWYSAKKSCSRAGKRLCTETEWERACKGSGSSKFPYGNRFDPRACNVGGGSSSRKATPTGAYARCKSSYGVFDLSGNVGEWTASSWSREVKDKVIKGGDANQGSFMARCSARGNDDAGSKQALVGFRCCSNP